MHMTELLDGRPVSADDLFGLCARVCKVPGKFTVETNV